MNFVDRIEHEKPLTLSAAAKVFGRISGRTPHVATVWRWCSRGVRGVQLDSITVGGTRLVTLAAIDRFIADTNGRGASQQPDVVRIVSEEQQQAARRAEIEAARARLMAKCGSFTCRQRPAAS